MTDQTVSVDKLRALLDHWEGFTRDELHHVGAAGVLIELRHLLPPVLPDPLFGARATHPKQGEGIVASHYPDSGGDVRFIVPNEAFGDGTDYRWVKPSTLTFHTPETPETPDHPEFLETEEDYRSAPEGTIVAGNGRPFVLNGSVWELQLQNCAEHEGMAGARRRVLRWGWEA